MKSIHCNACEADYKADRFDQHVKDMHIGNTVLQEGKGI